MSVHREGFKEHARVPDRYSTRLSREIRKNRPRLRRSLKLSTRENMTICPRKDAENARLADYARSRARVPLRVYLNTY